MKNSLNDLLKLRTNRIKKRDEKENFFRAHFYDFSSNFVYRSESTEDCSFNFFQKNNVNIDDATTISSSVTEMTKKKKMYRSVIFQASYSRLTFYYTERSSVRFFFIDFESERHFKILFRSHFKIRQKFKAVLQYESREVDEIL